MIRAYLAASALTLSSLTLPALADSTKAYCTLAWDEDAIHREHLAVARIDGPCLFRQDQGTVYVDDFNDYKFVFPAAEQGRTFDRDNKAERISFKREGHYTLNVFWERPGPKAQSPTSKNFPLPCQLNQVVSTCRTEPNKTGGFVLFFSHADQPIFDVTPVGPATTDRREMVDSTGKRWAMSGHHSFVLDEIGGDGNQIQVSNP